MLKNAPQIHMACQSHGAGASVTILYDTSVLADVINWSIQDMYVGSPITSNLKIKKLPQDIFLCSFSTTQNDL